MFVYEKGVLVVVYTDDCIFCGATKTVIRKEIAALKAQDFDLDEEEDMAGFLGVQTTTNKNGTKTFTQVGLIDRILQVTQLQNVNGKDTPAEFGTLGRDDKGTP